jgi:hypothetical protein
VTWQLYVAHRRRDDSLLDVAGAARVLEGEDRAVARELAMQAVIDDGLRTAGQLIDRLEAAAPEERRAMLDRARQSAGLPSIGEVEEQRRFEAANQAARLRAGASSAWQICGEPSCTRIPVNELGAPIPVDVRRWWCEQHLDLAAEGDLEPRGSGVRLSPSGALVPVDEGEEARNSAAAESRRRLHEARLAERQREASEHAEHRRAREAELRRLLPPGVPG